MEKNIHVFWRLMWLSKIYPFIMYWFLLCAMLIRRLLYTLSFYFIIVMGSSLLHKYFLLPFCEFQFMSWLSWLSGLLVAASEKGRSQAVGACQPQRPETPDLGEAVLIEGGSWKTWWPMDLEHRRLSFGDLWWLSEVIQLLLDDAHHLFVQFMLATLLLCLLVDDSVRAMI